MTNKRDGAYEITSQALVEWLWRTRTLPKIRQDAERAKAERARVDQG